MKNRYQSRQGYMTLMSVLVMGALGGMIAMTFLLGGLSAARGGFLRMQSGQGKAGASGCAEEALEQIRNSSSFTGTSTLSFGSTTCLYTVTNTGGSTRRITATSTTGEVIRKVDITISAIDPLIIVSSSQEVP